MIRRLVAEFVNDVALPRFTMVKGETWEVRPDRLTIAGFALGGGFVKNSDFKIISIIRRSA